jgi:phage/plasmid primase-like uncharacterized protein
MTSLTHTEVEVKQFLVAMKARNLMLANGQQLIVDGRWHRCDATNKPNGKNDGSYQLHVHGPAPWGLIRNWTDGKGTDYWRGEIGRSLTDAEQQEFDRVKEEALIEAEQEAAEHAAEARDRARKLWRHARDADASHPYLQDKMVKPHGLRIDGNLLVPMYAPDDDDGPVNLQFIGDDGRKWYLKGGQAKGCFFRIPGHIKRLVVCEGFATGASIHEADECCVAVAFSAGNLADVATMIRKELNSADASIWSAHQENAAAQGRIHEQRQTFVDTELIIAADDDWQSKGNPGLMAAIGAARAAHALVAVPYFGDKRQKKQTDFNDLAVGKKNGDQYIRDDIAAAMTPNELVERILDDNPHSAFDPLMIKELAGLQQQDRETYEKLLDKLKKNKIRAHEVDKQVKARVKAEMAAKAAAARASREQSTPPDIEALAASAREIIECKDVLGLFAKDFGKIYVGEVENAKLFYLIGTSRLFGLKETMHAAAKGPSSVGKSELMDSVARFMPPEDVFRFTSVSEKALLYVKEDDLSHKILIMAEAPKDEKQQQFQDLLLRELMSAGRLSYPVPVKVGEVYETITIEVEGPVAFWVSTTKATLNPENETRLIPLELDDSAEQTKRVMAKVAEREGWGLGSEQINFARWQDYQRWLAAGELRVYVPFVDDLVELIPPRAVRMRRDVGQLVRAIKVHALLHRGDRDRGDSRGMIMATLADYTAVRALMVNPLSETAEVKVRKNTLETVEAVKRAQDEHRGGKATVRRIAEILKLDQSSSRRRLYSADREGYITNTEERKGHPALYVANNTMPGTDEVILPTTRKLWEAVKRREEQDRARVHARRRVQ